MGLGVILVGLSSLPHLLRQPHALRLDPLQLAHEAGGSLCALRRLLHQALAPCQKRTGGFLGFGSQRTELGVSGDPKQSREFSVTPTE